MTDSIFFANNNQLKKYKYLPLILVEVYLLITLLILFLGPVQFRIHNLFTFIILIFSYHLFFILGYVKGINAYKQRTSLNKKFSKLHFYLFFVFGSLGVLVTIQNLMLSNSIIPYTLVEDIIRGITEPGIVYTERMMATEYDGSGSNRILNILYMFFAFNKFLFVFYFIWFWQSLNVFKKCISIFYSFFYLTPGIISGVNSIMFWFVLFAFTSLVIFYFFHNRKKLARLIKILSILILIPIYSFGNIMSIRGGSFDYFKNSSSIGDIRVNIDDIAAINSEPSVLTVLLYASVWMDFYLVQGYYGYSLILDKDFRWTYGFGNSAFFQRQLKILTGIDVAPKTYQRRNDAVWGEYSMWHSYYGQIANDVSPYGIILVMFFLGWFFSRIWLSVIVRNSFYGAALMPLFTIMFIFFPANNQVFGYIDTISYFFTISLFWILENFKFKL